MNPSWSNLAYESSESQRPALWQGLAGLWCPELGPSGGKLFDCSPRARHGTLVNDPLWSVGLKGWMLGYSAPSAQCVDCGIVPEIGATQHFTLAAWMELSSGKVVAVGAPGISSNRFEILCDGATVYFVIDGSYPNVNAGLGLHHAALVYDASLGNKAIRGYVDGQLAVEGSGPANTASIDALGNLYLGLGDGGRYSTGRIGAAAAFGRSLTADEVALLYADPLGVLRPRSKPRLACVMAAGGPYHLVAAQTFNTGSSRGQLFTAGSEAGMVDL
jgi:hypothetical protein